MSDHESAPPSGAAVGGKRLGDNGWVLEVLDEGPSTDPSYVSREGESPIGCSSPVCNGCGRCGDVDDCTCKCACAERESQVAVVWTAYEGANSQAQEQAACIVALEREAHLLRGESAARMGQVTLWKNEAQALKAERDRLRKALTELAENMHHDEADCGRTGGPVRGRPRKPCDCERVVRLLEIAAALGEKP